MYSTNLNKLNELINRRKKHLKNFLNCTNQNGKTLLYIYDKN